MAPITGHSVSIGAVLLLPYSGPVATFNDANPFAKAGDFTAMIQWGDGQSSAGTIVADAAIGGFDVRGTHAFPAAQEYSVTVMIKDTGGSTANVTSPALVAGYSPAQIAHAYGFDQVKFTGPDGKSVNGDGTGQTIAIVDAYDDPNIALDLKAFDQQFNLPAPPSFTKVDQDGGTVYPPENDGLGRRDLPRRGVGARHGAWGEHRAGRGEVG